MRHFELCPKAGRSESSLARSGTSALVALSDGHLATSKALRLYEASSDTLSMRIRQRLSREDGFTLVEAMVALVIIFGLMVVLLRTFDSSTRVLVETRRQSAANQFASELLERAQALEWQHMGLAVSRNGSSCITEQVGCYVADPIPNLAASGTGYAFEGEEVVFSNADTFAPFLDFHDEVARGGTDFDRYLFVTSIPNPVAPTEESARRITALVQWTPPGGFRKEVRLETIVSEFREPSQPLITGAISYESGFFNIEDRDSTLANGSDVGGTVNWDYLEFPTLPTVENIPKAPGDSRETLTASIEFPSINLAAVSDFISGTTLTSSGTQILSLAWNGIPEAVPAPNVQSFGTDDDATTAQVANYDTPSGLVLYGTTNPGFHYAGVETKGLTVGETEDVNMLNEFPDDATNKLIDEPLQFDADLWTNYDNTVLVTDGVYHEVLGKPFVRYEQAANQAPDSFMVGFTEYDTAHTTATLSDARYTYEAFGKTLTGDEYNFTFFNRTDSSNGVFFNGMVDRDDSDTTLQRTVTAQASFEGGVTYLFHDDAYPGKNGGGRNASFEGWVRITTPEIEITNVVAGEGAAPAAPVLNASGNLKIEQWDPLVGTAGAYVTLFDEDYETLTTGSCDAVNYVFDVPLFGGLTLNDSIRNDFEPYLDYEVTGDLVVHGWCTLATLDAAGSVSQSAVQTASSMVTGSMTYKVTDVYWTQGDTTYTYVDSGSGLTVTGPLTPILPWLDDTVAGETVLFDVNVSFGIDNISVNTVYEDPNA